MIEIVTVGERFAFFNTVTDRFVAIDGEYVFADPAELVDAHVDDLPRPRERLLEMARAWRDERERRFVLVFHVNGLGECHRGPFFWNDAQTERALLLNTPLVTWELGVKIRDTLTGQES